MEKSSNIILLNLVPYLQLSFIIAFAEKNNFLIKRKAKPQRMNRGGFVFGRSLGTIDDMIYEEEY